MIISETGEIIDLEWKHEEIKQPPTRCGAWCDRLVTETKDDIKRFKEAYCCFEEKPIRDERGCCERWC